MSRPEREKRWWPGGMAAGLAVAWALGAPHGHAGGLASVAITAVVAFLVGAPLAAVEWSERPAIGSDSRSIALSAFGDLWSTLAVGAILGPVVAQSGLRGFLLALALWCLLGLLGRRAGSWLAPGLALVAVAGELARAGAAVQLAAPYTLLEPHWEHVSAWGPSAAVGGLMAVGLGFGQWGGSERLPGAGRAPWLTAGLAILALLASQVATASLAEASPGSVAVAGLGPLLAACAAGAAIGARPDRDPLRHAPLGIVATAWFGWFGAATVAAFWTSGALLGAVATFAVIASRQTGRARVLAASAAAAICGLAVLAWPGLDGRGAAAAAAVWLVAAVWYAGTITMAPRRAEAA